MKTHLCIPRMRSNNPSSANKVTKRLSPMTLLDRFREAVFCLIMLSAVFSNKADGHDGRTSPDVQRYYCPINYHHSEAVADCIDFIKEKVLPEDQDNLDSSASASSSVEGHNGSRHDHPGLVM
ncbi:hypothetical protein ACFX13_018621 [Malus domestica]|uniref:Uncharacterized protein n=1 Tax=Malus domestica TaxID=3750 RepID=A0A498HU88_MALDO|nr:hypothetical protein DVH24_029737 [Malus domestica]